MNRRAMVIVGVAFCLLSPAASIPAAEPPPGPPATGSESLPDDWTGLISLEWESGIPDDSPLHQQVEYVSMRYEKRWNLYLTFHAYNRGPVTVRYRCTRASVDYFETSATVGKNGAITTKEIWTIESGKRTLDGHQCNLVLVVDSNTKKYWIEVGGFEIPDASKTGEMVIKITDENGTRTAGGPISDEEDVIEPIRFEGRYTENRPSKLIGEFDANEEPPAGVDITHETVGGTIAWQLYAGWSYLEDTAGLMDACLGCVPDIDDLRCRPQDFCYCLYVADASPGGAPLVTIEDCLELFCPREPGTPEFEGAIEALRDCTDEWHRHIEN